ncbi:Com family DNA-binding transcriptional regulator [Gemmobacter fulvus]|uniref:Com family DNA-binding transcriptional regulator n=1 Tax=Gemmobacter fulvus TaxID=2840474 RepID=A0A975P3N5_9RHOB|nr:Com family DNA-binding transcriptional regulator [Gemmobacter fulvus]QWK89229.1 Com family DNA-binding transcriptional regulator [Gemmobacter fulvus]
MTVWTEIRCCGCRRLLFKLTAGAFSGTISIKCPRCAAYNHLRPSESPNPQRQDRDGKDASCGSSFPRKT